MFEENEVWTPNHKYSQQNPDLEDYTEPTAGQSHHHMTAQMSPTTFGFWIVAAELLPGNPQADVFLANNSEQRLYLKIHLLSTLLMQIVSCYRKNGEIQIKEQVTTFEVLLKGPLLCKRARAWFKCSTKVWVDKRQDIAILIL